MFLFWLYPWCVSFPPVNNCIHVTPAVVLLYDSVHLLLNVKPVLVICVLLLASVTSHWGSGASSIVCSSCVQSVYIITVYLLFNLCTHVNIFLVCLSLFDCIMICTLVFYSYIL